jgi:N-acetyl-gamma-glutamyl-phosphate reductase
LLIATASSLTRAWVVSGFSSSTVVQRASPFVRSTTSTTSSSSLLLSTSLLTAVKKVFIDGEAGTTGLQVRERLESRSDLEIISAPFELRKDEETRKKLINEADAVILCKFISFADCCSICSDTTVPFTLLPLFFRLRVWLFNRLTYFSRTLYILYRFIITGLPDAASEEAASWVTPDNDRTVVIDASTAFRVNDDWVYGFPGMYTSNDVHSLFRALCEAYVHWE